MLAPLPEAKRIRKKGSFVVCSRRRKRYEGPIIYSTNIKFDDDDYYMHSKKGNNWNNGDQHVMNIPAPPRAWGAPPAPFFGNMNSGEMSSASYSGPVGASLPPPHPLVAIGFN
ncbi:hypothetical protein K1719_033800 [Acacia pycnantha]|nr:hypothetical protein K1719_033800 [Acacia pycnantha]